MNIINKFKSAIIGFGAFAATQAALAVTNWGEAKGPSLGQMSKNVSSSLVDGASALESFLYLAGVVFIILFIFTLVKWKKSDGREGNPGLIGIYLVASVGCMAAPTMMGGGMVTLFGNGTVTTVKPATGNSPQFNP